MRESVIQNKIRCALSSPTSVCFRTNTGSFWQGDVVYSAEFRQNVLINMRKVDGLPKGFSDLFVVDSKGVAFIETKTKTGKAREEQKRFISRMRQLNQRAGIARDTESAQRIVGGEVID